MGRRVGGVGWYVLRLWLWAATLAMVRSMGAVQGAWRMALTMGEMPSWDGRVFGHALTKALLSC